MADGGLTLKKFEFPYVPQVAVKQLESCVRGGDGAAPAIPGLGPSREELLEKLVEEHVFYRKAGRQGQARVSGQVVAGCGLSWDESHSNSFSSLPVP